MKRVVLPAVLFASALLALAGCRDGDHDDCDQDTPEIRPPDAFAVPETLSIGGYRLVARPYLWRDFMPVSPPDGKPMIASVHVVEIDSLPLPDGAALTHLWVLKGAEYWSTPFSTDEGPAHLPHELHETARCGPKWGPEIYVDVIIRIRWSGVDGYHIKTLRTFIERTD